jgi:CheY-like chemotaxis protein
MMPELDGFELIRALKLEAPAVPVIAVSVMNDMSNCRDRVVALGAELAMCKPVDPRELVRLVQQLTASPVGSASLQ